MKWYIEGDDPKVNYVNYYKRLLQGMLGKIKWFILADESALIVVPEKLTFNIRPHGVESKEMYSLLYDTDWKRIKIRTKDLKLILMDTEYTFISYEEK